MKKQHDTTCWIITEGMAGTENQCLGLTGALGLDPIIKKISLRFPWKQLVPSLKWGSQWAFSKDSDPLSAPWPNLLITSGRKAIPAALMIKKASHGKTKTVHIQDPRMNSKHFDLVTVPQHDPTRGENVFVTTGSLHRVTQSRLKAEASHFKGQFKGMPSPLLAIIIGGSSKAHNMSKEITQNLCAQLKSLHDQGCGLLITASRRTGVENQTILEAELGSLKNAYLWDGTGDNPYFAYLGLADYILVTEDSVSMTSEAISTGKPVYTIPLEGGGKRIDKFHNLLQSQGYTRPLATSLKTLETWEYTAPQDTKDVAVQVAALLNS